MAAKSPTPRQQLELLIPAALDVADQLRAWASDPLAFHEEFGRDRNLARTLATRLERAATA